MDAPALKITPQMKNALDAGFAAALGLVGLFCCAANSPIGGILLGIELFGMAALPYYALICLILWPLSAKHGLFQNRFFRPVDSLLKKQKTL